MLIKAADSAAGKKRRGSASFFCAIKRQAAMLFPAASDICQESTENNSHRVFSFLLRHSWRACMGRPNVKIFNYSKKEKGMMKKGHFCRIKISYIL